MSATAVLAHGDYEYDAEPTDGVNLSSGEAWWGVYVKYRKIGTRRWQRFYLVDVHSWHSAAIIAAIESREPRGGVSPSGKERP